MWNLFRILNLVMYFMTSFVWWSFSLPLNATVAVLDVLMLVCLYFNPKKYIIFKNIPIILTVIILLSALSAYTIGPSYGLSNFFVYLPVLMLYALKPEWKADLLSYITKWFSIILGISLLVYLLAITGIIPPIGRFVAGDLPYPPYENYIFFIKTRGYNAFYRFNGPFLEPGHLSMIVAILLYANKYDFKNNRYLWVLLVTIVLSFGLAGYVITIIGFLMIKLKSIRNVVILSVVSFVSVYVVTDLWNDGDNPVNILIFERLKYDEKKGIAGNNRTVQATDKLFSTSSKYGELWLGLGKDGINNSSIKGAGFKIYLLKNGIIATMLVFCLYWLLMPRKCDKRYAYSFLVLMTLIFLQRAYPSWYTWLLPYILGIGVTQKYVAKKRFLLIKSN